MPYELRMDSRGKYVGTVIRVRPYLAGDRIKCNGAKYLVIDACYDGNVGSAEVEPVLCVVRRLKLAREE